MNHWSVHKINGSSNDMVSLSVNIRREKPSGSRTIPGDLCRGRALAPTGA